MLIDWFTVVAQALNFLILVWLMKRFLYQPILKAIDEREQRIATELANAAAKMAEADKARDEFQQKTEVFDQQRAALLSQAVEEAQAERLRLLETARQAADALSASRQEALKNEAHSLSLTLSRTIQQEVFSIAQKALSELADTGLDERLVAVFTRRLADLAPETRQQIAQSLKTLAEPTLLRSAVELSTGQRAVIQNALNESFSAEVLLRYETDPELISGIEWQVQGYKLAWTIADYIGTLEDKVSELVTNQAAGSKKTKTGTADKLAKADPTP